MQGFPLQHLAQHDESWKAAKAPRPTRSVGSRPVADCASKYRVTIINMVDALPPPLHPEPDHAGAAVLAQELCSHPLTVGISSHPVWILFSSGVEACDSTEKQ